MANDLLVSLHGNRFGIGHNKRLILDGKIVGEQIATDANVIYVDSGSGDDNLDGLSPSSAVATLNAAMDLVTASQGDIIALLPGHAETLSAADGVDIDKVGISIIGLGEGTDRPTFTYTVAAATFAIGADNVYIENCVFNASVTVVALAIDIEDGVDYVTINNCQFGVDADGTDEFNATIHLTNNNTGCIIENNTFDMGVAAAVQAIHLDADTLKTVIRGNTIHGSYSTACISGDTTLSSDILIYDNILQNGVGGALVAQPTIELLTGTTGTIANNLNVCNVASPSAAIVADTCMLFNNKYSETIAEAAFDLPINLTNTATTVIKKDATFSADDLFDVNTGSVLIHSLFGITTTVESGGTAPVVSLQNDVDSGTDIVIATGLNTALIAVSDTLTFLSHGSVLVKTAGGVAPTHQPFVTPAGVIESVLDSGCYSAGDITWICTYSPITSSATVSAAA